MSVTIEDFLCPCCRDYVFCPIYQCVNTHIICDKCKSRLASCPVCRVQYGDNLRNYQLEELARQLKFPCSNECYDCKVLLSPFEKKDHEIRCDFKQLRCPFIKSDCTWMNGKVFVVDHLREKHNVQIHNMKYVHLRHVNVYSENCNVFSMLMQCYNEHFFIIVEPLLSIYGALKFLVVPRIIGVQENADQFHLTVTANNSTCFRQSTMAVRQLNNIKVCANSFLNVGIDELNLSKSFNFSFFINKIS